MFAFEFAILLITSTGILCRYILSLVEKYILYKEAARRKAARAIERTAARQRRITEREARRAAGDEVDEAEEEEDDDDSDEELDVGGWEEKGTWVFYSELGTGTSFSDSLSSELPPAECLYVMHPRFA